MISSASSAPDLHRRFVVHMVEGTSTCNPETLRSALSLRLSFLDRLRGYVYTHVSTYPSPLRTVNAPQVPAGRHVHPPHVILTRLFATNNFMRFALHARIGFLPAGG